MSVTRVKPRTRPSGHWSIDFTGLPAGGCFAASTRHPVRRVPRPLSCGGACPRGRRRPRPAAGVGRARPRLAHAIGTRWPAAATTLSAEGTASPRPRLPASSPVSRQDLFPLPRISAPPDVGSPVDRDPVVSSIRFVSASFSNDSSIGDVLFFFFRRWTSRSVQTPRRIVSPPPLKERLLSRVRVRTRFLSKKIYGIVVRYSRYYSNPTIFDNIYLTVGKQFGSSCYVYPRLISLIKINTGNRKRHVSAPLLFHRQPVIRILNDSKFKGKTIVRTISPRARNKGNRCCKSRGAF